MSQIERKEAKKQPGVYIFQRDAIPLYIGATADLSKRPIKRDRGHASRWAAILQANNTELIPCKSVVKAKQLEERLIRANHPIYNLRNPRAPADIERTWNIIRGNW